MLGLARYSECWALLLNSQNCCTNLLLYVTVLPTTGKYIKFYFFFRLTANYIGGIFKVAFRETLLGWHQSGDQLKLTCKGQASWKHVLMNFWMRRVALTFNILCTFVCKVLLNWHHTSVTFNCYILQSKIWKLSVQLCPGLLVCIDLSTLPCT